MEHDSKKIKIIFHCAIQIFYGTSKEFMVFERSTDDRVIEQMPTTTILSREILMTRQVQRLHNTIYHRVTYDQLSPLYEEKRHAARRRRERALLIVPHVDA